MEYLNAFRAWASAHPEITAAILLPLIGALWNLLFKPKTPEQYEWVASKLGPRVAGFLVLMGTLFPDPDKAGKVFVEKLVKGKFTPKGPGVALLVVGALAFSTSGCGFLQEQGPAIVDALASKAKCGLSRMNLPDEEIVKQCALQPGDADLIMKLIGIAREEAANEAVGAANRQAEQDQRTGVCH